MYSQDYNEKFMDMPKTKAGADHSSGRFNEVILVFGTRRS